MLHRRTLESSNKCKNFSIPHLTDTYQAMQSICSYQWRIFTNLGQGKRAIPQEPQSGHKGEFLSLLSTVDNGWCCSVTLSLSKAIDG